MISDLVLRHRGTLVMVGDPHQQIYRFRGAVDALNSPSLATADRLWLTGSFRVGPCVADVANAVLALWWFSVGMTEKIREPARFAAWESFSESRKKLGAIAIPTAIVDVFRYCICPSRLRIPVVKFCTAVRCPKFFHALLNPS